MAEMPGPDPPALPPGVPTALEVVSAAGGVSLSPRRSLAKSLLSDAVSHSSLAWSEFWFDRSGDLAAARRGGGGTVARASSGPGAEAERARGGGLPSAPLAAFSRSCFSLRNRGGLSCCCALPCRRRRGRSPSSVPTPKLLPRDMGDRGPEISFSFKGSLLGGRGPAGGFFGTRDLAGGLQPEQTGGGGRPPPRPRRDGTPLGVKTRPPRAVENRAGAGDRGAPGGGGARGT